MIFLVILKRFVCINSIIQQTKNHEQSVVTFFDPVFLIMFYIVSNCSAFIVYVFKFESIRKLELIGRLNTHTHTHTKIIWAPKMFAQQRYVCKWILYVLSKHPKVFIDHQNSIWLDITNTTTQHIGRTKNWNANKFYCQFAMLGLESSVCLWKNIYSRYCTCRGIVGARM